MKKLFIICLLLVFTPCIYAQRVQVGFGYGMGYYYNHMKNFDVLAWEYNLTHTDQLKSSDLCFGPDVELVLGRDGSGLLFNWMMRGKKYAAGEDVFRTKVRRTGFGFKFASEWIGCGLTLDYGKVRLQVKNGSSDWGAIYSSDKDWYIGTTLFADVYAAGRIGLRLYWMHEWIYSAFGNYENYKYNFSNIGFSLTAYMFRNGGSNE